jgi:hypothetical protein
MKPGPASGDRRSDHARPGPHLSRPRNPLIADKVHLVPQKPSPPLDRPVKSRLTCYRHSGKFSFQPNTSAQSVPCAQRGAPPPAPQLCKTPIPPRLPSGLCFLAPGHPIMPGTGAAAPSPSSRLRLILFSSGCFAPLACLPDVNPTKLWFARAQRGQMKPDLHKTSVLCYRPLRLADRLKPFNQSPKGWCIYP